METSVEYSEMLSLKYRSAVINPLRSAWEFLQKPRLSYVEKDWKEINKMAIRYKWSLSLNFKELLRNDQTAIVITNIKQEILFTSSGFEWMTGYKYKDIKGRKPNFLQGKDTDKMTIEKIRTGVKSGEKVSAKVLNYKKDGTPYYCQLNIQPVYNRTNELVHFIAIENPV